MSLTLGIFIAILLVTIAITYWAAKRTSTTADFYAADSTLTSAQNGLRWRATGAARQPFSASQA